MPTRHFRTTDGVIITYDDALYQLNTYNAENTTMDIVRLSDSQVILVVYKGFGTEYRNMTGVTSGTFLGMPRLTLP